MSDPLTIALLIAILAVQVGGFTALWLRPADPRPARSVRPHVPDGKDVH